MPDGSTLSPTLAGLAAIPRWVAWQAEDRKGKTTKVPYSPGRGMAKSDDPATWGTRLDAAARARALPMPLGVGGVGIMLGEFQDLCIAGLDLDSCRAETGDLAPWASDVLERFPTYAEVSPSKTGVKLFFILAPNDLPELRRAMWTMHGKMFKRAGGGTSHPPAIELHVSNRYFATTDDHLDGTPRELRRVSLEALLWLIREGGPAFARGGQASGAARAPFGLDFGARGGDQSRSGAAYRLALDVARAGGGKADWLAELDKHPETAAWRAEKEAEGGRELARTWSNASRKAKQGEARHPDDAPEGEAPEWHRYLQRNNEGDPRGNLANAMTALSNAPEWKHRLAFDEMQRAAVVRDKEGVVRALEDVDVSRVHLWMQRSGLPTMPKDTVFQGVDLRARDNAFHPVRRYLRSLTWDGVPRLDGWLTRYMSAAPGAYATGIGRMFLLAMVARVEMPGCKADYMIVLEGDQGAGKSTACRILGGAWFSDNLPDLDRDDIRLAQHLRGKWLVEIAELSATSKADAAKLKEFVTRTEEKFTPKYGRNEVHEPRQCVFIGTTNKEAYLRDETGARRFWPVKVGTVDLEALARDRDQLFAEAFAAYQAGEAWWPAAEFEKAHIAPQQEARFEHDAWEEAIEGYLAGQSKVTLLQVAREALHIETPKLGTADQNRIRAILSRLGWAGGGRGHGGVRYWSKGATHGR